MVQVPLKRGSFFLVPVTFLAVSSDIKNHSFPGLTKGKWGMAHAGGDVLHKVPALVLLTTEV